MRLLGRAHGIRAGKAMPMQATAAWPLCSAPPALPLAVLTGCVNNHAISPAILTPIRLPS